MIGRSGLIIFLGFLLSACTAEPDYSNIAPRDQIGYAGQFLDQIRTGAIDAALEQIPEDRREAARSTMESVSQNFPKQEIRLVRVVGYTPIPSQGEVTGLQPVANIDLRYEFVDDSALIASVQLSTDAQRFYVSYLNFTELPASLIAQNSFPGPNATWGHYIYLFVAMSVFAFILYTLYVCIRGPGPRWRWRWLWLIAIAIGAIRFNLSMVWTSGQMVSGIGFVPFGIWVTRSGVYTPYVIIIGFPLGAILFWALRSRWRNQKVEVVAANITPPPAPEAPI